MSSENDDPPTPPSEEDEASSTCSTTTRSEVHFAFGPSNWYFVRLGTRWRFIRSNSSIWENLSIYNAHWVALKHDTGFLIGGEEDDGDGRVVHSWNDSYMVRADNVDAFVESRDAYIKLHDWINERVEHDAEEVKKVSISIGPKGSYFARHGTSQLTHALPKDLQKAISESDSSPVSVALGIRGAWIVLWADGTRSWHLRNAYPSLASSGHLKNSTNPIAFAALSPYAEDHNFVVMQDGSCSYNVSNFDTDEGQQIHEITDSYMRMRARRDGTSFTHGMTLNGVSKQVRITPSSSEHESKAEALIARLRARHGVVKRGDVVFLGVVVGGAGVVAKVAGLPTLKVAGVAASTGVGAALAMWFRG